MSESFEANAPQSQIGIIGDTKVNGGIHFHAPISPIGKPLQRPPQTVHFTDRERELTQLLTDLQPGQVVTLCGPGGIGKTALAAEAIWKLTEVKSPLFKLPSIEELAPETITPL